jgi:hypothetical protein
VGLQVTLKTTIGDLDIELWPKEAPKVGRVICSGATATRRMSGCVVLQHITDVKHVSGVLQDAAVHRLNIGSSCGRMYVWLTPTYMHTSRSTHITLHAVSRDVGCAQLCAAVLGGLL